MSTNLELKVRCTADDLAGIRESAQKAGIGPFAAQVQQDTYFHAPNGRLKLREIRHADLTEQVELIGYSRPDLSEAQWSHYTRVELPLDSAEGIRAALDSTLGVSRIVEKVREVAVWRRTRIHLDDVQDLGLFVELETVTDSASDSSAQLELRELAEILGIDRLEPVSQSYGDMPGTAK